MKKKNKLLLLLALGILFLMSTSSFAAKSVSKNTSKNASKKTAKNECYSAAEFKDFKTLYIDLQKQLNYEGQDAYLDTNMQVQLKPHAKNTPYPGKEFETALFSEYQNSLRKIGKLYQDAKYENDDNFKSNETLINFMKAIEDKNSNPEEYINKTKITDVINALEEVSKKKYASSADKKFVINSGDKYLLEKLLTHSQDRVCSVSKYNQTQKDTKYFKADYLLKIKNAPLNLLVNAIQTASISKDSKIDLKPSSTLTADLVDTDIAIKSALTENLNQLSEWVKKIKANGPNCLASIKTKSFANTIQGQIQGCNFSLFMETLGQDNTNNLEAILHFINANEKLLDFKSAKAETSLDELKLEGFISKAFESLGSEIKCTIVDSANAGDKKVFVRNLPYDEKLNTFDTSSIVCKTDSKPLSTDTCKKQFDMISDSFGRGIELKPKAKIDLSLIFSIKDAKTCSNIAVKDLISTSKTPKAISDLNSKDAIDTNTKGANDTNTKGANDTNTKGASDSISSPSDKDNKVDTSKTSSNDKPAQINTGTQQSVTPTATDLTSNDKPKNETNSPLPQDQTNNSVPKTTLTQKTNDGVINQDPVPKPTIAQSTNDNTTGSKTAVTTTKPADTSTQTPSRPTQDKLSQTSDNGSAAKTNSTADTTTEPAEVPKTAIKDVTPSAEQLACESNKKDSMAYVWMFEEKKCLELSPPEAKIKCEAQSKPGYKYEWSNDSLKCIEKLLDEAELNALKNSCEQKKNNDIAYTWDATKKTCNEAAATEDAVSDEDKCIEKNTKWVKDENDGTPKQKYLWDGKECKDNFPAEKKTKDKNVDDDDDDDNSSPLPPKDAPERFKEINVKGRTINLLQGMP